MSEDIRSKIYNDFASKCPNLLSQIQIPSKIRERADKSWKGNRWRKGKYRGQEYKGAMDAYDDNFNNIKSVGKRMTCQLTQDPNTCFFYAMYNMKKNQLQLENTITGYDDKDFPDTADFDGETPKSEKFRRVYEDFRLPLGQNEMLIMKVLSLLGGKE